MSSRTAAILAAFCLLVKTTGKVPALRMRRAQ